MSCQLPLSSWDFIDVLFRTRPSFSKWRLVFVRMCFFFAFQIIANDKASKEADPIAVNACQMSVAALLSIPCALMVDSWPEIVSIKAVLSMAYSILLRRVWLISCRRGRKVYGRLECELIVVDRMSFRESFAILVFHEVKTWTMYLGGGLIFVSILLVEAKGLRLSNPLKRVKYRVKKWGNYMNFWSSVGFTLVGALIGGILTFYFTRKNSKRIKGKPSDQ